MFESVERRFSPVFIRAQVERFDVTRFKKQMAEFVAERLAAFHDSCGVVGSLQMKRRAG